jgi:hypothetical protein
MKRLAQLFLIAWPFAFAWSEPVAEPRDLVARFVESWNSHMQAPTVARGNNLLVARFAQEGWIILAGQVARART